MKSDPLLKLLDEVDEVHPLLRMLNLVFRLFLRCERWLPKAIRDDLDSQRDTLRAFDGEIDRRTG